MMTQITYRRIDGTVNDGKANGKRGTIQVDGNSWHSIERMDGYKWLRPGVYECEFALWTSSSGNKSKAIRVLGSYSNGRIYIHPANKPSQLAGCIAPGKSKTKVGVGSSRDALSEIFDALGGYVEGAELTLKVEGSMAEAQSKILEIEPGDVCSRYVEDVAEDLLYK